MPTPPSHTQPPGATPAPLTLLIDGLCPLCKREAAWLARRDRSNKLRFVDIADPAFNPSDYNRTLDQLMGAIHAVRPSGQLITGVEVFRDAYSAIGLGWLLAPTRWPILRQLSDAVYRLFARVRPLLQPRHSRCTTDRCKL